MCNIAGYSGDKRAAPILVEMLQNQEGFAGGYYTGIATISGGRLYHAKVIGDTARLVAETDALDLPGNIGIIHSRSKSGGDVEWSHPFIDCTGQMAYVANGSRGFFTGFTDEDALAEELRQKGHTYRSREKEKMGKYPALADGTCVHSSEVMCHLIEENIAQGLDPAEAIKESYLRFPGEIVGLMLHASRPDTIFATRINQPMMVGYSPKSLYLATSALVMPDEVHTVTPMPVNSAAAFRVDSIDILPFNTPPADVSTNLPWEEGYSRVVQALFAEDHEYCGLGCLKDATADIWPEKMVPQKDFLVYEILRYLYAQGRIDFKAVEQEGVLPGLKRYMKVAFPLK